MSVYTKKPTQEIVTNTTATLRFTPLRLLQAKIKSKRRIRVLFPCVRF